MPPAEYRETEDSADDLLAAGAAKLGIHLSVNTVAAFRTYREDLLRWSQRINLTALATPAEIVQQGFLDSLACAPLLPDGGGRIIDIGSGAGFPAVPLALVKPGLDFTLVEPSRKKATFLRQVIRRLKLTRLCVFPTRAEALQGQSGMRGAFDIALARAVAPLPDVGRMVLPFLRPAGIFLAQIGPAIPADHTITCLARAGFEIADIRLVPAEFGKAGRRIIALKKSHPR